MGYVRTYLDVVEMLSVDARRDAQPTTIPGYPVLWMTLMDVTSQLVNCLRLSIAAHQGYASDVVTELADKGINGRLVQRLADVLSQVAAVAPGAMAWTA